MPAHSSNRYTQSRNTQSRYTQSRYTQHSPQHLSSVHSNGMEQEGNGATPLCHTRPQDTTGHCSWTAAKQQRSPCPFVPQQTCVTDHRSVMDKCLSGCLSLISNTTEMPYQKAAGKSPPSGQKTTIKTLMGTQERPC